MDTIVLYFQKSTYYFLFKELSTCNESFYLLVPTFPTVIGTTVPATSEPLPGSTTSITVPTENEFPSANIAYVTSIQYNSKCSTVKVSPRIRIEHPSNPERLNFVRQNDDFVLHYFKYCFLIQKCIKFTCL